MAVNVYYRDPDVFDAIPTAWLDAKFIQDKSNHPGFEDLSDEYDFPLVKEERGLIYRLMQYTQFGPNPIRKPYEYFQSYYYFASTALYMLKARNLGLRTVTQRCLNGKAVVAQVNAYGAPNISLEQARDTALLEGEVIKAEESPKILDETYHALWARIFNAHMAITRESKNTLGLTSAEPLELKVEERSPIVQYCPNCGAFHKPVTGEIIEPDDPRYDDMQEARIKRIAKTKYRNANG